MSVCMFVHVSIFCFLKPLLSFFDVSKSAFVYLLAWIFLWSMYIGTNSACFFAFYLSRHYSGIYYCVKNMSNYPESNSCCYWRWWYKGEPITTDITHCYKLLQDSNYVINIKEVKVMQILKHSKETSCRFLRKNVAIHSLLYIDNPKYSFHLNIFYVCNWGQPPKVRVLFSKFPLNYSNFLVGKLGEKLKM